MKLRSPWLIRAAAFAGSWVVRAWMATLRFRYLPLGPNVDPFTTPPPTRYLYAFWHETMLLPAYEFIGSRCSVLISQHADGELIARVAQGLGIATIRGSTTRGGAEALWQLLHLGSDRHLVFTPDGPRGPRRRVKQGMIFLASRLGLPIAPAGFGFDRPWRLKSWDRFILPRPRSRAVCVTGVPIRIPPDLAPAELEEYRLGVEAEMLRLTHLAEWCAETGAVPCLARLGRVA
jgi:hypothetical protein